MKYNRHGKMEGFRQRFSTKQVSVAGRKKIFSSGVKTRKFSKGRRKKKTDV